MIRPVKVEPRPKYRIWVEFSDGVAGEIDLSDVAGRGVFAAWNEPGFFEKVHVDSYGACHGVWADSRRESHGAKTLISAHILCIWTFPASLWKK